MTSEFRPGSSAALSRPGGAVVPDRCPAPEGSSEVGEPYDPLWFARLAELEDRSFWFRGRSDLIEWVLCRYLPGITSFMEVGCGTGYVLGRLCRKFPDIEFSGSEPFAEGLQFARTRVPESLRLYQTDLANMPFEQAFDAVGAFDVIEHIRDDRAAVRTMRRALKPGGRLVLTVPQHEWLWSRADVDARHVRRYTRRILESLLRTEGFVIERITSFVALLLPVLMLSRLCHRGSKRTCVEAELSLPRALNEFAYTILRGERALIRAGFNFPMGGSLLAVARKATEDERSLTTGAGSHPRQ